MWTYTYDDVGNAIKKSKGAVAETWNYSFDTMNRLTQADQRSTDGGTLLRSATYTYDLYGNRLSRSQTVGSTTTAERFAYDGWDTVSGKQAAVGQENWNVWADLDTSNVLTIRRLYGAGTDDVVARISAG